MAKLGPAAFGAVNRLERQQKSSRNKLYKELVRQGEEAIQALTQSIQNIQSVIDGIAGVGYKNSYTFSMSNPGEANITIANGSADIELPNVLGNRSLFVQLTENSTANELVSAYVGITETTITLSIPASMVNSGQEYTVVVFG